MRREGGEVSEAELQDENERLRARVDRLKAKNRVLKARVRELEEDEKQHQHDAWERETMSNRGEGCDDE